MLPQLVAAIRVCCVAAAFSLLALSAAEPKAPSLIGISRDQVLARLGEPKSNIVAGAREVLFFPRQRVVLRDNVVIEVEQLPAEPPRRPPPPPPVAEPVAAPVAGVAAASPAPAVPAAPVGVVAPNAPVASSAPPSTDRMPPPAPEAANPVASSADPARAADAPLVIKSVRSAPSTSSRTAPVPSAPRPEPAAVKTEAAAPAVAEKRNPPLAKSPVITAVPPPPAAREATTEPPAASVVVAAATPDASAESAAPSPARTAPVKPRTRAARDLPEESLFGTQTYFIAFGVVAGLGYLFWRRRQHEIELAATTVSEPPFASGSGGAAGARFTPDLLAQLEWKRFEELVASYYAKTGVVAVRTKTGPASPVHVRISWKGEPRPFACVQCIAHPKTLIDAPRLQELFQVLTAEDIRRGYVVSTGKFNVGARDFAEEKHMTLLPGELFLEKLNALPDAARHELMQEITTGDYTTPSCTKCEAKMTRSPDDPTAWRCAEHPDVVIAGKV